MFTDMVGSTASAQVNEAEALKLRDEQEGLVRPLFAVHQGREIKSMGDGFLAEFDSALRAVQCAIDIHQHLHDRNSQPGVTPIQLRIGIHLGDVEQRGTDIFGDAVNVASRIEPVASPGGLCISGQVFDQVRNKIPNRLEKLPPTALKGVRGPLDIYRVVLPWAVEEPMAGAPTLPRLAVLPLANISPDAENEYFADGLTEELITVLSQIKGLRVISRTSVNQYKGTTKPVAQIGSELGVDSVLEGSVRKAGDQLRIAVQLITTRTDEHRWAQTYNRKLENVFAIQADVAERTAAALKVELLSSEREAVQARPTSSLEAYEAYLRGVQASQQFFGRVSEELERDAVAYFEEAIRYDPRFSAAYARLADHLIMVGGETRPSSDVFPRARELVAKALELNPNSSEAHAAQANLLMQLDHAWDRAEAEYQQAIALNPSNSIARFWYGSLLSILQRFAEAKKQLRAAIEQDPLNVVPWFSLAAVLAHEGDLGSAVALAEKSVQIAPDNPGARAGLASLYVDAGRADDALQAVQPLAGEADPFYRANRAAILALGGRPQEARAFLSDWEAGRFPRWFALRYVAAVSAAVGDHDRALALLERDEREGEKALWNVYLNPVFDPIRDDPRFVAILRAENLPTTFVGRRLRPGGRRPAATTGPRLAGD